MDRRRRPLVVRAPMTLAVLAVAAGCTGSPSSTSSWQSSTDRTLGTVISGLGTARIVVREESQNDLPHSYAVVSVTDAIDTSAKEVSSYLASQPPDRLHRAHAEVTRAMQDGIALLVDVRVSLASPGLTPTETKQLTSAIDTMRDRLDKLDGDVMESPGSVGAS